MIELNDFMTDLKEKAKDGYEYRLERDYPGEWIDNITSELDRVKKLLKEL